MEFLTKGIKFKCGWRELLVLGIILLSLLGKKVLWPSLPGPAANFILRLMGEPNAEALNYQGLPDSAILLKPPKPIFGLLTPLG